MLLKSSMNIFYSIILTLILEGIYFCNKCWCNPTKLHLKIIIGKICLFEIEIQKVSFQGVYLIWEMFINVNHRYTTRCSKVIWKLYPLEQSSSSYHCPSVNSTQIYMIFFFQAYVIWILFSICLLKVEFWN